MITIQSAESALRNIYLDVVINDINTKTNPFLTMINKNTREVAGKEIRVPIRYGDSGNVAAVKEDAELPVSTNSRYTEIQAPLKNIYGTFQITDKAIRASQTNAGAFANLLSGEMQNLIATAQSTLNTMIYGNGKTLVAHTTRFVNGSFRVPMRFVDNIVVGEELSVYTHNNENLGTIVVATFDCNTGEGTFTGTPTIPNIERFYLVREGNVNLNGVDSLFLPDTNMVYNIDVGYHQGVKPFYYDVFDGTMPVATEDDIICFLDGYEEHCQSNPADIILTHPMVRKSLFESLRGSRSNVDVTEIAGGFQGFSFNGIPVYADVKCKGGALYALNSDSWAINQLCDWTWLSGDDGSILRQIDGRAAYNATLVKYADLICERPFLQGKVSGFSVNRWRADQ